MAKPLHPSSIAYWTEGKLKKKIRIYSKQESFFDHFTSVSASSNLSVGGNIHASGTITCDSLNVNEINSSTKTVNTLEVVDKVILAMSGAYPNNADGAGFQIGGHSTGSAGTDIAATFFYNASNNSMDLSTTFSSSGDIYSLGSVSASNNLAIGGNAQFSGSLSAASLSSSGDVYVLGSVSASNDVTIGGNLYISGTILGITASIPITALNNKAENRLVSIGSTTTELDGEANLTFNGSVLTVAGNVSASGDYYTLGSVSASNNLAVGGNAEITGSVIAASLSASGDVYALGSVSASNNLSVGGNTDVTGNVNISGDIYVDKIRRASDSGTTTKILLNDEVVKLYAGHSSNEVVNVASGVATVAGNVSASGDVYALGSVSASSNLAVGGNVEVTGSIIASSSIQSTGFVSANGFGNSQTILTPTVVPAEYNCLLYGPVTIRDKGTLQIGSDSVVVVRRFLDFTGSLN